MKISPGSSKTLTGPTLFLFAGLAAMGLLATNVILPVFPGMSVGLGVGTRDLGLTNAGLASATSTLLLMDRRS